MADPKPCLAHFDIDALTREALAMEGVCGPTTCVAPTVHLLARLLREATELQDAEIPCRNCEGVPVADGLCGSCIEDVMAK